VNASPIYLGKNGRARIDHTGPLQKDVIKVSETDRAWLKKPRSSLMKHAADLLQTRIVTKMLHYTDRLLAYMANASSSVAKMQIQIWRSCAS